MGPQSTLAGQGWSWSKWHGCLWVGGIVGLLVESALEEAVGDCRLAWAAVLAAPEATELGCLDGITWHGELEEMSAREDCCGEGRSETEDLPSPFEDLFVHGLQLERRRGTNWLVYVSRGMRALCRT